MLRVTPHFTNLQIMPIPSSINNDSFCVTIIDIKLFTTITNSDAYIIAAQAAIQQRRVLPKVGPGARGILDVAHAWYSEEAQNRGAGCSKRQTAEGNGRR